MARLVEVFRSASKRPMEAIEVIIAFCMFAVGVYLLWPGFVAEGSSTLSQVFTNYDYAHVLYGLVVFILPSLPILLGLFSYRFRTMEWRTRATFCMFVALVFTSLLRIVAIGLTPVVWVFSLALGSVSAVCYLYARVRR